MNNIFDGLFNDTPHGKMYQAWVFPDLFPREKQPVLINWHREDLAAFIGGQYTTQKGIA